MASVFKNLKKKGGKDNKTKKVFEEDIDSSDSESDSQKSDQEIK